MGSADPRAFARGKRAIAGSLVFIQFDVEPLLGELTGPNKPFFLADIDDLRPEYEGIEAAPLDVTNVTPVGTTSSSNYPGASVQNQESDISSVGQDQMAAKPWYPDQILPFDIVLTAANEYGALALMKVLGVELMNSGNGVSIDDIVMEHSYTYIAAGLVPWTSLGFHPQMQNQIA